MYTHTLTPLLGMEFWRTEGKCSHGKNSEKSHELHDDGDLNESSVAVRDEKVKTGMA